MRYYLYNFGVRERYGIKKMASDNNFTTIIEVFNKLPSAVTKQDVIRAGEEAIIDMYTGKGTLNSLRYQTFRKKY